MKRFVIFSFLLILQLGASLAANAATKVVRMSDRADVPLGQVADKLVRSDWYIVPPSCHIS